MCAILGGTDNKWDYDKALKCMEHRGPDGHKICTFDEIVMGFNRLAIVDLSEKGMQPMLGKNGVAITFNGEIYGFKKLKVELEAKGHRFDSNTDTEVILNSYLEWGEDFIDHIDGMFAIAIFDPMKRRIITYRDRAGIKPLFYYYDGRRFAYASELKGLKTLLSDVDLIVDNTAMFDYHNYYYIPDPKTMYKNVYKLESGHKLIYDIETHKILENKAYWELLANSYEGDKPASDEIIGNVKNLIAWSINEQIIADVQVGGFLSGGIDSSLISLEAINSYDNYILHSIGFYDYDKNEIPYVRCMEKVLGVEAKKYYLKKNEFKELYYKLPQWYDEPFADTSAYPSYVVSREAKKDCTVMLAGDGGDEIFGGYGRYKLFYDYSKHEEKSIEEDLEYLSKKCYGWREDDKELRNRFGISEDYDAFWFYRKYYIKDLPPITRLQYMDYYTYLPGDILQKMDRVSMACSLEVRVPLISRKIVEYAFSCTEKERCYNGELKSLLKQGYAGNIPNNILYRRKAGFAIPIGFFGYGELPQDIIYSEIYGF